MSYSSAIEVSQRLIHFDALARKAIETDTVSQFVIATGEQIVSARFTLIPHIIEKFPQKEFYTTALAAPPPIPAAMNARVFLHTFVQECRVRAGDPKLRARLVKKLLKFDARGATLTGTVPESTNPVPPPINDQPTSAPIAEPTGPQPERQKTPIPAPLAIPEHRKSPMPAPIRFRSPSPFPVAGPGPVTQAYYAAVVAGAVGLPDEVPTRERSHSDRGQATSVGGLRKQDLEEGDPRLGDLDADGQDEDSVMGPTDSMLARALAGVDENDEEGIDGGDEDEGKPAKDSRMAKGKQRARSPDDARDSDDSDWSSWGKRVIVSRPKPIERPEKAPRRHVTIRPSGTYFDIPCLRCVNAEVACEKDRAGGACVFCKKRKQSCQYAGRRTKKPIQSKAEIESEDDASDRPISSHQQRHVSRPPIAVLTPLGSVPARPRKVRDAVLVPTTSHPASTSIPETSIPTRVRQVRTGAPPVREAATKATQAIRQFTAGGQVFPPPADIKPSRQAPPTGTQSRSKGKGEFIRAHI